MQAIDGCSLILVKNDHLDSSVIVAKALPLANTLSNITGDFRVSGNFQFNRDIFQDTEFYP